MTRLAYVQYGLHLRMAQDKASISSFKRAVIMSTYKDGNVEN